LVLSTIKFRLPAVEESGMRHAMVLAVAISSAVSIGCGSSVPQTSVPTGYKNGQPTVPTPEEAIAKLETPEDRATYLRQLGTDSSFEPQKHVGMLEKCAKESNEDVATAAKELLERK
jgi:hypothetical protein